MEIKILNGIEGAREARGTAVIIDVFRAFSLECFLFYLSVSYIYPVADADFCLKMKKKNPDCYLIGERNGIKLPGFDEGNSPSCITAGPSLCGKTVYHCTSAGTQGVSACIHADDVLGASFLNAAATARYILKTNPSLVSIVAMGLGGVTETDEDNLCADYISALLSGSDMSLHERIRSLKDTSGMKFFGGDNTSFPIGDFFMCLVPDIFDFAIRINRTSYPFSSEKVLV